MKNNYHTHTSRCQHAEGRDEEYVLSAIQGGFDTLGFADHAPWPFQSGFVSPIRMPLSQLDDYLKSIRALKEKYRDQITIRVGLEAEFFPRYKDYLQRLLDEELDYLILGHHYLDTEEENPYVGFECMKDDGVKRYADQVAEALQTGMFSYVAHPDLFMRHRTEDQFNAACCMATNIICQAAKETGKPIEFNLLGLNLQFQGKNRGYPSPLFWKLAKQYHNKVILGLDAHNPGALLNTELWSTGRERVLEMGYDLQESLPMEK